MHGTQDRRTGEVLADISNAVVGILRECYGRGPTRAKSYMCDNYVFTVLEDLLTTSEETLVAAGREELVREVRLVFEEQVSHRFKDAVSAITGRRVIAYQSQVTFHPPMGFEIFVLEPEGEGQEEEP